MNSPTTFKLLLYVALAVPMAALAQPSTTGFDYQPETAFHFTEGSLVSTVNSSVKEYNRLIKTPVPPAGSMQELGRKEEIGSLKKSIEESKKRLADERARRQGAKNARAAQSFPECAQLPWGATPQQVTEILTKRGAKVHGERTPERISFRGGNFVGEEANAWECKFVDGKLYSATVYISRELEGLELFRAWNEKIARKYYVADAAENLGYEHMSVDNGSFKDRIDGPAVASQAIAMGDVTLGKWRPAMQWAFSGGSRIALILASPSSVAIAYVNGSLEQSKTEAQRKAKDSGQKDL